MAFCNNCGIKVVDGAKFCQKCGEATNGGTSKHEGQRQQEYAGKSYKCPNCGEVLKSFVTNCPSCGYELRGSRATNSIRELALKLEAIESRREHKITNSRRSLFDYNSILNPEISKTDEQKATLIRTFPIPNTKEDLFEFIILAQSNVDSDLYANDIRNSARVVSDAWKSKFEQAFHKAEVLFTNDSEFQHIQTLNQKMSTKIKKSKSKQWMQVGIIWGILVAISVGIFLLVGIRDSIDEKREIARLEAIVTEVEISLDNGEYELALLNGESINFKYREDESIREWIRKKKILINRIISEAKSNGVILSSSLRPIGANYNDLQGTNYESVVQLLKKNGFTNISILSEQKSSSTHSVGEVKSITIDGDNYFLTESSYRADAYIIITYWVK